MKNHPRKPRFGKRSEETDQESTHLFPTEDSCAFHSSSPWFGSHGDCFAGIIKLTKNEMRPCSKSSATTRWNNSFWSFLLESTVEHTKCLVRYSWWEVQHSGVETRYCVVFCVWTILSWHHFSLRAEYEKIFLSSKVTQGTKRVSRALQVVRRSYNCVGGCKIALFFSQFTFCVCFSRNFN